MSSGYWSNLRPFEKRVVVGIGVLFFIVLNFLFIIPHFSDLAAVNDRMGEARRKLARYQNEIAQTNTYAIGLREFEKENSDVPAEEQSIQFANTVNAQAGQSGVHISSAAHINTQTNQFFLEKTQSLGVQAGEQQLVDFLYNLGSGNSQVRVRDLSVRPDPPRQQLAAQITLVASYQKKSTARPAARPASAPGTHAEVTPTSTRSPVAAAKDLNKTPSNQL
jgi:type II secretory pathway component PulM